MLTGRIKTSKAKYEDAMYSIDVSLFDEMVEDVKNIVEDLKNLA